MTSIADVHAAVTVRLHAAMLPATAVWDGPPDATGTPAVWCELVNGTGPGAQVQTMVRVVYVPAPRSSTVQHPDMVAAVDALHAAFVAGISPDVYVDAVYWAVDRVDLGAGELDAVFYDLSVTHHLTC